MNQEEIEKVAELFSLLLPETTKTELFRKELKEHINERWHPFTVMLKDELRALGYWQNKPRGDPSKGFKKGWGKRKHNIGGES